MAIPIDLCQEVCSELVLILLVIRSIVRQFLLVHIRQLFLIRSLAILLDHSMLLYQHIFLVVLLLIILQ